MPETRPELELDGRLTRFIAEPIPADLALQSTIDTLGGKSSRYLELAAALIKLATREQESGNYTDAESFFGKALVIGERALGSDHPALLPALTGLGVARMARGASVDAESTLDRALTICESRIGEDEPELVILLNDLVRLCLKQSLHAFAEPPLLRLLAIKRTKGENRPEVATVLASLGFVHQSLGRHQSAEQLWTRVVEIREQTLAPNHLSVATALEHLADACTARGKIAQALELLERAQAIREVTLGKDHSSLRLSRERVADLQLQASEDHLEEEDSYTAPPAPAPGRIGAAENRIVPAPPQRERITATIGWTSHTPVASEPKAPAAATEPNRALSVRDESLPSLESAISAIPQQQPDTVPYREIILSMQSELEPGDEKPGLRERAAILVASAADFFRKRDRSVEIGIAAMTLVLIAFAGSRAFGNIEDAAISDVDPNRGAPTTASAVAPVVRRPGPAVDESLNAAAARNLAAAAVLKASRTGPTEKATGPRRTSSSKSVTPVAALPTAVSVNLDSVVRSMNATERDLGAAILSQPATTTTPADRPSFRSEETVPARPATLIGAMPVPRYPMQHGSIGGEVRIRFMVDTLGRPVMPTFTVVSSPDPRLTAAVKNVVPRMRFEPARTEGPDAKLTMEWVGTVFRFER
jgi:TonB family protein